MVTSRPGRLPRPGASAEPGGGRAVSAGVLDAPASAARCSGPSRRGTAGTLRRRRATALARLRRWYCAGARHTPAADTARDMGPARAPPPRGAARAWAARRWGGKATAPHRRVRARHRRGCPQQQQRQRQQQQEQRRSGTPSCGGGRARDVVAGRHTRTRSRTRAPRARRPLATLLHAAR
eukprot:scaffold790_cov387-Prasinococcus_capsulatus_cf.AAC.19